MLAFIFLLGFANLLLLGLVFLTIQVGLRDILKRLDKMDLERRPR